LNRIPSKAIGAATGKARAGSHVINASLIRVEDISAILDVGRRATIHICNISRSTNNKEHCVDGVGNNSEVGRISGSASAIASIVMRHKPLEVMLTITQRSASRVHSVCYNNPTMLSVAARNGSMDIMLYLSCATTIHWHIPLSAGYSWDGKASH
jgi:hypothetical protein